MKRIIIIAGIFFGISCFKGLTQDLLNLNSPIPIDTGLLVGKLDNGLTYYIKKNSNPQNRAVFRLVVNAGAILEDDDQNGLAHFIEHMAFNGTKNFPKNEMVSYFKSTGVKLGAELNGATGIDQTLYELQVRTDDQSIFEKAFFVCAEWAHNITFDEDEIERERGVILEEWRLKGYPVKRMQDKQNLVIFKDSKYANRNVTGDKDVILNASRSKFLKFYNDWYRPDLMAIVIAGDFEIADAEALVKKYFSEIPKPPFPVERKEFEIPDHLETRFAIASDEEAANTSISIMYKKPVSIQKTIGDFRNNMVSNLFNNMFCKRLQELERKSEAPFIFAYSYKSHLVRTKDVYELMMAVKANQINSGIVSVLTEAERIKRYGFTESEFERQKVGTTRFAELRFGERDKIDSKELVWPIINDFLTGSVTPSEEIKYKYIKELLPTITLAEVNEFAKNNITEENRVVTISMPKKKGIIIPDENNLLSLFDEVKNADIKPYMETIGQEPIISNEPNAGKIIDEKYFPGTGVTEIHLSNGAKVILKQTGFKNDEVIFKAVSMGGASLLSEEEFPFAALFGDLMYNSGVDKYDRSTLTKKLSGKIVGLTPYIGTYDEGLDGYASSKDAESLFQLIYLYFAYPRKDDEAFKSYKSKIIADIDNRNINPVEVAADTLNALLTNHHYAARPLNKEALERMDPERMLEIYRERFADAADFSFIFTGSFQKEMFLPLIEKYIACLPSLHKNEKWRDTGLRMAGGIIQKEIKKGIGQQSYVFLSFTGDFLFTPEQYYTLKVLNDLVKEELRMFIREEKGGTYSISCNSLCSDKPRPYYVINIDFGCAPERADELSGMVFQIIEKIKTKGPDSVNLANTKETLIRTRETELQNNQTWVNEIYNSIVNSWNLSSILNYREIIKNIDAKTIRDACGKYFNTGNFVKVILKPEKF